MPPFEKVSLVTLGGSGAKTPEKYLGYKSPILQRAKLGFAKLLTLTESLNTMQVHGNVL